MNAPKETAGRSKFPRFTLREMFLLLGVACAVAATVAWYLQPTLKQWRQQRRNERLIEAAGAGDAAVAADLIAAGVDHDALASALRRTVDNNDLPMAKLLLDAGAGEDLPYPFYSPVDPSSVIRQGHVQMLELLLEHGMPANLLFVDANSDLPAETEAQTIKLLLTHGADTEALMDVALSKRDSMLADKLVKYGAAYTPRVAAELGRLDDLKRLIAEDPSWLTRKFPVRGRGEMTLLAVALERPHAEMAHFLLEAGAPVDVRVYFGFTLLHCAVLGGDPQFIPLLAKRGVDLNVGGDASPLCLAIRIGHTAAAEALIDVGADVDARNNWGTPLAEAVTRKNLQIAKRLLAAGADPTLTGLGPETKESALDIARRKANAEILSLLEQAVQEPTLQRDALDALD